KKLIDVDFDELIGSLLTHEEILKREGIIDEGTSKRNVAFSSKVEKTVSNHEDLDDDEIAFLSKQVSIFLKFKRDKKKAGFSKSKDIKSDKESEPKFQNKHHFRNKKEVTTNISASGCFKCGRTDHLKVNCPYTKREKDRGFLAAWSASEDESEDFDGDNISAYMAIATEKEHSDMNNSTSEVCIQAISHENKWVLDSGCSHHMTGDKSLFSKINLNGKGNVTFGDNRAYKILGTGLINFESGIKLSRVHLVDGLKHNLL
ncbi:hypothetical protein LINGRAHAP2_LOCUS10036, partial [Linum grandiflorum]